MLLRDAALDAASAARAEAVKVMDAVTRLGGVKADASIEAQAQTAEALGKKIRDDGAAADPAPETVTTTATEASSSTTAASSRVSSASTLQGAGATAAQAQEEASP